MRNLPDDLSGGEKEDFGVPKFQNKAKVSLQMKRNLTHRWVR